jgi:hypothetical protein
MGTASSKGNRRKSSVLEEYLRCGAWKEAREFLASSEGKREVHHPIGLISYNKNTQMVTPAVWTSIFHHAPIDIVKTVYKIRRSAHPNISEVKDLLHVALEHDDETQRRPYDPQEHLELVRFLVETVCPSSSLKIKTCTFPGNTRHKKLHTPLGHALSLPNKTAVVRYLAFVCPEALETDCQIIEGHRIQNLSPLALSMNNEANWKLMLMGANYFASQKKSFRFEHNEQHSALAVSKEALPPPSDAAIDTALGDSFLKKEWKVAAKILKDCHRNNRVLPDWLQGTFEEQVGTAMERENWKAVENIMPAYNAFYAGIEQDGDTSKTWAMHQIEQSLRVAVKHKEWYGVQSILPCLYYPKKEPDFVKTARKQMHSYMEWEERRKKEENYIRQ